MPTYQRRQSSSALPIIIGVVVLLVCGISAAAYFAINHTDAGNTKKTEASGTKDNPPVHKTEPKQRTQPTPKPANSTPTSQDTDREWIATVESELAQVRQKKRTTEPVKGRTMTTAEYQVAVENVTPFREFFPIDSVQPYKTDFALLSLEKFPASSVLPETTRVLRREAMTLFARQSPMQLDTLANNLPALRPLLDESFRKKMLNRIPRPERKELHTKFAGITGDNEAWSLLHPFDDLDGSEMNSALDTAQRVKTAGLRSLTREERALLLRAGAADFVERSMR